MSKHVMLQLVVLELHNDASEIYHYTPGSTITQLAGKWGPRIESMYFLLKMGTFHCHVSFIGLLRGGFQGEGVPNLP